MYQFSNLTVTWPIVFILITQSFHSIHNFYERNRRIESDVKISRDLFCPDVPKLFKLVVRNNVNESIYYFYSRMKNACNLPLMRNDLLLSFLRSSLGKNYNSPVSVLKIVLLVYLPNFQWAVRWLTDSGSGIVVIWNNFQYHFMTMGEWLKISLLDLLVCKPKYLFICRNFQLIWTFGE